jgi:cellulose synthase/poly-beta-1,6-N-acetylglucosamine synthase-like glycosyltransferase
LVVFFWFLLLLAFAYSIFLVWCWWGWQQIKETDLKSLTELAKTTVSIIIPARNEEKNIQFLLEDLVAQKLSSDFWEAIVVNDHSSDGTVEIVKQFIQNQGSDNIKLLDLSLNHPNSVFKKSAITEAINISTGELIITTDADCRVGDSWLLSIVSFYEANHSLMISAPVKFSSEKNWFEKIQSLEFMGLIGIGAGAISNRHPLICNGANLAFTKEVFHQVNGYSDKNNLATGDDTQLLLKISKLDKNRIHFLKSSEATVDTTAKSRWKDLFSQKKRWASKIPYQMNGLAVSIAVIAYLLNLGLLFGLVFILSEYDLKLFMIAFLLKIFSEFLLLNSAAGFIKKRKLLWLLLPAQLYYCLYVIIIGAAALFGTYEWKGRKTR